MRILKSFLVVVGFLGALLTFPMPSALVYPGAWVFLGISVAFAIMGFIGLRIGRRKETPEAQGGPETRMVGPQTVV